jgi:hypothetical protein
MRQTARLAAILLAERTVQAGCIIGLASSFILHQGAIIGRPASLHKMALR